MIPPANVDAIGRGCKKRTPKVNVDRRMQHYRPRPRRRTHRGWAVLMLGLYWALLFVGTHLPPDDVPEIEASDKTLHFLAYAGLAFLTAASSAILTSRLGLRWVITIVLLAGYAALDEFTQPLVGRTAEMADWLADLTGVVVGLIAYTVVRAIFNLLKPRRQIPYL